MVAPKRKVEVIGRPPNLVIEAIYACVAVDTTGEGLMGATLTIGGQEMFTPLVGADEARIRQMVEVAKMVSAASGLPFRVYKFSLKEDVTDRF